MSVLAFGSPVHLALGRIASQSAHPLDCGDGRGTSHGVIDGMLGFRLRTWLDSDPCYGDGGTGIGERL